MTHCASVLRLRVAAITFWSCVVASRRGGVTRWSVAGNCSVGVPGPVPGFGSMPLAKSNNAQTMPARKHSRHRPPGAHH